MQIISLDIFDIFLKCTFKNITVLLKVSMYFKKYIAVSAFLKKGKRKQKKREIKCLLEKSNSFL